MRRTPRGGNLFRPIPSRPCDESISRSSRMFTLPCATDDTARRVLCEDPSGGTRGRRKDRHRVGQQAAPAHRRPRSGGGPYGRRRNRGDRSARARRRIGRGERGRADGRIDGRRGSRPEPPRRPRYAAAPSPAAHVVRRIARRRRAAIPVGGRGERRVYAEVEPAGFIRAQGSCRIGVEGGERVVQGGRAFNGRTGMESSDSYALAAPFPCLLHWQIPIVVQSVMLSSPQLDSD